MTSYFPKTISEECHVLSNWKNNYGDKYNNGRNETNDGIVFSTMTEKK